MNKLLRIYPLFEQQTAITQQASVSTQNISNNYNQKWYFFQ